MRSHTQSVVIKPNRRRITGCISYKPLINKWHKCTYSLYNKTGGTIKGDIKKLIYSFLIIYVNNCHFQLLKFSARNLQQHKNCTRRNENELCFRSLKSQSVHRLDQELDDWGSVTIRRTKLSDPSCCGAYENSKIWPSAHWIFRLQLSKEDKSSDEIDTRQLDISRDVV